MRRRIALLVAATTSLVLVAFLLPLALLISRGAESSAVSTAVGRSQALVPLVAVGSDDQVGLVIDQMHADGYAAAVALPDGRLLGDDLPVRAATAAGAQASTVVRTGDGDALIRQPVFREDGTAVIAVRVPRAMLHEGVVRAWLVLTALALVLVVLSLLVADRLARSMTRPITELAHTAERLGHGDLDARVVPGGPDEVREVGLAVNWLAARIRELLATEREAVADLSHRLRTPVTALRLDAEALTDPEERARLGGDVDELTRQVDALIRDARRPVREGAQARCDARSVVEERVGFWRLLAEEQGRRLDLELPARPCLVRVDAGDLGAVLDALLGNGIAHTPEGTALSVTVRPEPSGGALVVVADEGAGFSDPAVLARGQSRAGSTGLGLDIVRRTAAASGGEMRIGTSAGGGATVTVRLGPPSP